MKTELLAQPRHLTVFQRDAAGQATAEYLMMLAAIVGFVLIAAVAFKSALPKIFSGVLVNISQSTDSGGGSSSSGGGSGGGKPSGKSAGALADGDPFIYVGFNLGDHAGPARSNEPPTRYGGGGLLVGGPQTSLLINMTMDVGLLPIVVRE